MVKIPKKENIILAGDFIGRLGKQSIPECIETNEKQVKNHNGAALRNFCVFSKLKKQNRFTDTKT
jgi:DNA-binding transcriptional regulator of glucitol operon